MVTLTPQAGEILRGIIQDKKLPVESAIRVGVTTEGCEGSGTQFRYVLEFDEAPARPDDHVFESEGLKVRVDETSLPHVQGLRLDARREMGGLRFAFQNPNAGHACGCGHTFSKEKAEAAGTGEGDGHGRHHGSHRH